MSIEENKKDLTDRERGILDFMKEEIKKNGFPPSVREICKAVNLKSTASVHTYLESLTEKGYIKKVNKKTRALKILSNDKEKEFSSNVELPHNMVNVPIVGKVTAGLPILAVENIEDTFPVPIEFIGNNEAFMLKVRGDSMIEAGILNGDYILVKKQSNAVNGEMVVALIDDEATVKTFYKEEGHIRLQPENSTMEPIIVPDCKILGKVAGVFRKI